jgi:cob(I)alamin adenosyltransferase
MRIYTGKGDQGESNLFDGRRISKGDPVFEVIGSLDEATAFLGLAISFCHDSEIIRDLQTIQDHLSKQMSFLAGVKISDLKKKSFLTGAVDWLENKIKRYEGSIEKPKGFVFAGKSSAGASIDISRTVIRRAEREAVIYFQTIEDCGKEILTYLNRLSSFLYVLRLFIDYQ